MVTPEIKSIIFCVIYSKPNSHKKTALLDHVITTYNHLKTVKKKAKFVILGDTNDLKLENILNQSASLKQIVHFYTRELATLDIIITDLHTLYRTRPVDHLQPDNPDQAMPSDHIMALGEPLNNQNIDTPRETYTKLIRPITIDQIMLVGQWLTEEKWESVKTAESVDANVPAFNKIMKN